MSTSLEQLWRNRIVTLVANLATGEREHEEIANLERHIRADYKGRFLIELLQNANDQARIAGQVDTTIVIVRTADAVAITNEGTPFNEDGIRAITSLGVSPKDPKFTIGNKGVGFKAVFEVTDAPEIYSAPVLDAPFDTLGGAWIQLHQAPLEQPGMRQRLALLVESVLAERPADEAAIARIAGCRAVDAVISAIGISAPFRYPIPLGHDTLKRRLAQLSLPSEALRAQTLVVLPLLRGADNLPETRAQKVVDDAFAEFVAQGAAIVLFLDGVAQIIVDDRVRKERHELRRLPSCNDEQLARGGRYVEVSTSHSKTAPAGVEQNNQRWLIVSRRIGADTSDTATAHAESSALNQAARHLPGKNWHEVSEARVSVAVSIPGDDLIDGSLGCDGYLCIGLPTRMRTETPLWVDARFHGDISRTKVIWTEPYNLLLCDEAVLLVRDLIDRLKRDESLARRRLAALVLEPGSGALTSFWGGPLFGEDGVARGAIVLAQDGEHYFSPCELALPSSADEWLIRSAPAGIDLAKSSFVLADDVLLRRGRKVLEKLPGYNRPPESGDERFLQRLAGDASLVERAASHWRNSGPGFWGPFLRWLLDRYSAERLADQRTLPVMQADLAAPERRVFYRPWKAPAGTTAEELAAGGDEQEEDLGVLPQAVVDALPFLDETVVQMREGGKRKLTALGSRLASAKGGLVRAPRRLQLINEVIVPKLRDVARSGDAASLGLGMALLQQALRWASLVKPDTSDYTSLRRGDLLVPVVGVGDRVIAWNRPDQVYFGRGWHDGRRGELLSRLHGDRAMITLASWSQLEAFLQTTEGGEVEREWWVRQLASIGVADAPRVRSVREASQAMYGSHYRLYSSRTAGPWSDVELLWQEYLESLAGRELQYKGGYYHIFEAAWIDGLEREEARAATFELMVMRPADYERHLHSRIVRDSYREFFQVRSFWAWALSTQNWPIVPLVEGVCEPQQAWLLEHDQRGDTARFRFLRSVPARFDAARSLLSAIGVTSLAEAPPNRIIRELHDLAALLPLDFAAERSARALAAELYSRLATRGTDENAAILRTLRERPIPVVRGEGLIAAAPAELPHLFVDDDPARRAFLGAPDSLCFVPLRAGTAESRLAAALRLALGERSVSLTSQAAVDSGFTPDSMHPDALLLDVLEAAHPWITIDLGLLAAYCGRRQLDPTKDEFQHDWERLKRTRVRRGRFRTGVDWRAFFEPDHHGEPVLMVDVSLASWEILEQTWMLFGIGHRDAVAAYAREAARNDSERLRRFFRERRIGDAERLEIESVLGQGWQPHLQAWKPAFFALWRRTRPDQHLERFEVEWKSHSDRLATLAAWLSEPTLERVLPPLRGAHRDDAITAIVDAVGLQWQSWRAALAELGVSWQFERTERDYRVYRRQLWAALAASAAKLATVNLDEAAGYLAELEAAASSPELLDHPSDAGSLIKALATMVKTRIEEKGMAGSHARLLDRLDRMLKQNRGIDDVFTDPSKREVSEFANYSHTERSERAADVARNYLDLVKCVASEVGESDAASTIGTDRRLRQLREGYFASRYSFLPELSARLARSAPLTFQRLSSARVFDTAHSRSDLARMFPSMLAVTKPAPKPAPPPRRLFGVTMPADKLLADLQNGSGGALGAALKKAAASFTVTDVSVMLARKRNDAPALPDRKPGGPGGGGKPPRAPSAEERELLGLLGEAFAYELFCKFVPGFDYSAWVTENAVRYGVKESGNDGLGADFHFFDQNGVLSGVPNTECFVEVKASAGDTPGPFSISFNEWLRAEECHVEEGKLYFVVRVANVAAGDGVPRVLDIMRDPVQLKKDGKLRLADQDMWVYVGSPQ